jgi:hypothetical protein
METHFYQVTRNGETFARTPSFMAAVGIAKDNPGAEVFDSKPDGSLNLRRWHQPIAAPKRRKVRHVLVKADGSTVEFGSVRGVHG